MKEFFRKISKRTWVRIVLIAILTLVITFAFMGEKVAVNDNIGWDGENYKLTMQHFTEWITHHGYDQYAIRRVLPWGITNIVCGWMGLEVTREVVIASGIIYNIIALILCIVFFFRISNLKRWKLSTETLGFVFLFYTYPVLKIMGYYPVLSDIFGLTMGIMLCYYFFADKKWALVSLGFVGAFIWPTTSVCAFALAFFPRKELLMASYKDKPIEKLLLNSSFVIFACIPLAIVLHKLVSSPNLLSDNGMYYLLTKPSSEWALVFACLCACLYYYYIVSAFKISLFSALRENLTGKIVWRNYLLFMLCLVVATYGCKFLANSNPGALTVKQTVYGIALSSSIDPFIFIENHFFFFGLGYLLILFLWKEAAKVVMQQGLGYLFVVSIWALFSIRPEARVSIMYMVFPMMALLMVLDKKDIRPWAIGCATAFSLVLSRFWYRFNVPNMEQYLSGDNWDHYIEFPAQRYFMNSGHWQSHDMYYLFMTVTILCLIILYIGKKNQWFTLPKK